jgi:hypothetical protein
MNRIAPVATLAIVAPLAAAQPALVEETPAPRTVASLPRFDRTPLHDAALAGDLALMAKLLDRGAEVDARDANGETPLHLAARRQRVGAIDLLLAAGADASAVNGLGRTALHLALANAPEHADELDPRVRDLARALLDAGLDPNAADDAGVNPLRLAIDHEKPLTIALLEQRGAVASPPLPGPREEDRAVWPSLAQVEARLQAIQDNHPAIALKVPIGVSEQGRPISAIRLSDNVGVEEFEAELSYISTMHGDEIVGTENCLRFAEMLAAAYGQPGEDRLTSLVDDFDLWIIPLMNPDGYERSPRSRSNANGVDLNRDFPDPYTSPNNTPAGREDETAAIMNWKFANSFVLSANFHGGALLVNYPYDSNAAGANVYTACPDDDLFIQQSLAYSVTNAPMYNSPSFPQGITNGADWYVAYGAMQDWNYRWLGCNEVTIELSNVKQPSTSQIEQFWLDNRESMIAYLETARWGVNGLVTDSQTAQPLPATVAVSGRDHDVYTDPDVGDYHRMLLDGTYELRFEATGYEPVTATGVAVDNSAKATTRLDIAMDPTSVGAALVASPNGGESLTAGQAVSVTWTGPATSAYQLQHSPNYNDTAVVLDGFESGALDPAYATSGNRPWLVQSGVVLNGSFAAASGNISDNQISVLERTVQGPGTVSFFYRVSTESGWDFFNFSIDGAVEVTASGSTGWAEVVRPLPAGTHTLRWEYAKDGSVSSGADTVWIDDAKFVTTNTDWFDIVAETPVGATAAVWVPTQETSTGKVRVRKVQSPGVFGPWDESNATFVVVPAPAGCAGDVNGDGETNVFDFSELAAAFGSTPGDAHWNPNADLNDDDEVDVFDFSELAANFGCVP